MSISEHKQTTPRSTRYSSCFSKQKTEMIFPKQKKYPQGSPNSLVWTRFLPREKIQSAKEPEQDHHGQGLRIFQQWGEIFLAGDAQLRWHQVIPGKMAAALQGKVQKRLLRSICFLPGPLGPISELQYVGQLRKSCVHPCSLKKGSKCECLRAVSTYKYRYCYGYKAIDIDLTFEK